MPISSRNRLVVTAAACSALALPVAATAQQATIAAVQPQGRVRFTAPTVVSARQAITGSVVAVNDTALVVRWDRAPQDEPLVVPFRALTSLDVSEGQVAGSEGRGRGARTGALAGAGLGLLAGIATSLHLSPLRAEGTGTRAAGGLAIGGVLGTGIGALLGGHGYERWKRVTIPRPRLSLGLHRRAEPARL